MPETIQSELVEKLRALDAAATGGTWVAAPFSSIVGAPIVSSPSGRSVASVTYFDLGDGFRKHDEESAANAELVTFLRNAVPDILGLADEITRLRTQRDDAYGALRSLAEGNLGDLPWQANYQTVKLVASMAIPPEHRVGASAPNGPTALTEIARLRAHCEAMAKALQTAHDLLECIEQRSSDNMWWVNAFDPETACGDAYHAADTALAAYRKEGGV